MNNFFRSYYSLALGCSGPVINLLDKEHLCRSGWIWSELSKRLHECFELESDYGEPVFEDGHLYETNIWVVDRKSLEVAGTVFDPFALWIDVEFNSVNLRFAEEKLCLTEVGHVDWAIDRLLAESSWHSFYLN